MSDRMPEDMPDKVPECLPDRMPEDLPVTKCINVMVGITRSKVFFFGVVFHKIVQGLTLRYGWSKQKLKTCCIQ